MIDKQVRSGILVIAVLLIIVVLSARFRHLVDPPSPEALERFTGYKFEVAPMLSRWDRQLTGPFWSDRNLTADYAIAQADLKVLTEACEKYGFKRYRPSPQLPEQVRAKLPTLQKTAVCVKVINDRGEHAIYVGPDGLEYVYVS